MLQVLPSVMCTRNPCVAGPALCYVYEEPVCCRSCPLLCVRGTHVWEVLPSVMCTRNPCVAGPALCYVYEEPLLYDTFPDDFVWGTATAAYQATATCSQQYEMNNLI